MFPYPNGPFGNMMPYTDFHAMNQDWIIQIVRNFLDQYTHIQDVIDEGLEDLEAKATQLEGLLQAWYDEHSQDIADQLADALQDLNAWYTEHQNYLNQTLQTNIAAFDAHADAKGLEVIASIPNDYTAVTAKVNAIDTDIGSNLKQLTASYPAQYLNPANRTAGKYYWHNGTSTTDNANTSIFAPFRVYAGVPYSFINVYGYFCTLVFDDGTTQALTDDTSTQKTVGIASMAKTGWAYVSIYNTALDTAMVVAGDANYTGDYFLNYGVNKDTFPGSSIKIENELMAIGNSNNIRAWGLANYTVDGNEITYVAPAAGTYNGFYVIPAHRINVKKVLLQINAESQAGMLTAHVWDTNTTDFASHLYTLTSFNTSKEVHIDLEAIAALRPSMNMNNWVILISNNTNDFTFVIDSIVIKHDEGIPAVVDGYTLGNVIKNIYEMTDRTPLTVECGPGKTYTRLRDAIEVAETVKGSKVIVYAGVYDLTQEFASEILIGSGSVGIELTNDVYVEFLPGAKVTALFPNSSAWISTNFQPFYAGGSGFTLDGLDIEARNCRYCVHDERAGADVSYHNVYKNCKMKFTMDDPSISEGTSRYIQCIGGGLGKHGYIEIDGGQYTTVNNLDPDHQEPITYHNGVSDGCQSNIFIKDVMLTDKGRFRFGCYGVSTAKTPVYVCGCSMYSQIYKMFEVPADYQVDNFEIIDWNNTIRG